VNKYLPLGSVVILNNGTKRVMIYGRKQTAIETGVEYDYLACLYPEGNIDENFMYLFNNEDIKKVFFRGYEDEEYSEYIQNF